MSDKADKIFSQSNSKKIFLISVLFCVGLLLICGSLYIAFKSIFLSAMFCFSLVVMFYLKEKIFGLVMTFLSVVILLLKVCYNQSLTLENMSERAYILIGVTVILGIILIAVSTILREISFHKIIATKKSL